MKFKLKAFLLIVVFINVALFTIPVYADSPEPANYLTICAENIPENAVYADLLIKISSGKKYYTDLNENNLIGEITADSEIVSYCKDGYISFTFHYKNASSDMKLECHTEDGIKYGDAKFARGDYGNQFDYLRRNYSTVCIVLLDADGNVICVSDKVNIKNAEYGLEYNAVSGKVKVLAIGTNYRDLIFICIISLLGMVFTMGIETLVGFFFGFRGGDLSTIAFVNLISKLLMSAAFYTIYFGLDWAHYFLLTTILEVLVYTGETMFYLKDMKDVKAVKIIAFSITANTVTLLLGLLFFRLIF